MNNVVEFKGKFYKTDNNLDLEILESDGFPSSIKIYAKKLSVGEYKIEHAIELGLIKRIGAVADLGNPTTTLDLLTRPMPKATRDSCLLPKSKEKFKKKLKRFLEHQIAVIASEPIHPESYLNGRKEAFQEILEKFYKESK